MVRVHFTRHLFQFFPHLAEAPVFVEGETVAELLRNLEPRAPGIGFYICDELGRLRIHVNIFVGTQMVKDRRTLSDAVPDGGEIHILQALSGG